MATIPDTFLDGPCLPFVKTSLQVHVGHGTCHSIKELERDIKNSSGKWPAILAKQLSNMCRAMHTRAAPYIRHPVEHELHGCRKKRRILRQGGLQEGREKELPERASEAAVVWNMCEDQTSSGWTDNFAKTKKVPHPSDEAKRRKVPDPLDEDADIDYTAFDVLPTVEVFHFDGRCTLAHASLPWVSHGGRVHSAS